MSSTVVAQGRSLDILLGATATLLDDITTDVSTTALTSTTTMTTAVTEKPYDEFTEVITAVMIDRIYIPTVVTFGLIGNGLSFVTLIFSSLRGTSTCVYMAAIAVLDSVILILDLCVLIRGYMGHTQFYLSNDWACGFHNFLFYFSIHWDVIVLLAMTFDRYLVVRFPLKAQSWCTPKSAVRVISLIGLFSFALNFQILFTRNMDAVGNELDPLKCVYTDPDVNFYMMKIYTWIDASIYSFVPFTSLLILNALIITQLRSSMKFREGTANKGGGTVRVDVEGDSTLNSGAYTSQTEVSYGCDSTDTEGGNNFTMKPASTISDKVQKAPAGKGLSKSSSTKSKSASTNNITSMLLLVSFTFLLLTSPVVIVLLYKRYYWLPSTNEQRATARLVHAFVDNIMYTNHAVNFLLYCLSGRRFRNELSRLLGSVCGRLCCRN